jgi:hypothetical protein
MLQQRPHCRQPSKEFSDKDLHEFVKRSMSPQAQGTEDSVLVVCLNGCCSCGAVLLINFYSFLDDCCYSS